MKRSGDSFCIQLSSAHRKTSQFLLTEKRSICIALIVFCRSHFLRHNATIGQLCTILALLVELCYIGCFRQWWSVTKSFTSLLYLSTFFQVSVLYWSNFILSNFYFYFNTLQSLRSYFLLIYISENISLLLIIHHMLREAKVVSDSWTNYFILQES